MEVIIFYSYKGGVGKTLAAANLALCLSKIGRNCALLDLDFDSPSMHYKFGEEGKPAPGAKGGFLYYFLDHINAERWPKGSWDNITFSDPDDLLNYVQTLKMKSEKDGCIHLIPAGNIFQTDYWDNALSPLTRKMFRIHKEKEKKLIDDTTYENCIDYFLNLRRQISLLKPSPEYLIVDLRSGSREIAITIFGAWPGTLVSMFTLSEDNLSYMNSFFQKSKNKVSTEVITASLPEDLAAKHNQANPSVNNKEIPWKHYEKRIVPVLCRVPTGIEFRGDRLLRNLLSTLGVSFNELFVLHSDRKLEMIESLRLGFNADAENTRLTHDYIKLFGSLIHFFEFDKAEFRSTSIKGLCKEIKADGYEISLSSKDNTIEWLNELLTVTNLYDIFIKKHPYFEASTKLSYLISQTEASRQKIFKELSNYEQKSITKVNRLILEEKYPLNTPKSINSYNYKRLYEALNIPADIHEQDRIFRLETDRGALINPNDDSRNVSFKVETFQLLLKGLQEGLFETLRKRDEELEKRINDQSFQVGYMNELEKQRSFEDALFTAGKKCGEKFGDALSSFWSESTEEEQKFYVDQVKILKWCHFDSDVGFGKFDLFPHTVHIVGGKLIEGDILLRESFLTPSNDTFFKEKGNHVYCSLISGYIQGVLNRVLDDEIDVSHITTSTEAQRKYYFPWIEARSESCIFHFKRVGISDLSESVKSS